MLFILESIIMSLILFHFYDNFQTTPNKKQTIYTYSHTRLDNKWCHPQNKGTPAAMRMNIDFLHITYTNVY